MQQAVLDYRHAIERLYRLGVPTKEMRRLLSFHTKAIQEGKAVKL